MFMNESTIQLNNGSEMPRLGFGTWRANNDNVKPAIRDAISVGYRLIDTASAYKNEEGVGLSIRRSSLDRKDIFVTTKVWNNAQRKGAVENAFNRSLERLGLDYVDLYLIHWPVPGCYMDTWRVLEDIYRSGRAKAVGVSNFTRAQLEELMSQADIIPAVNQIEFHPLWNQDGLARFCQQNGIVVQAYAPLARGAYFERPLIQNLAEKYNRTPAQIGLRWLLQKDICPIPKSVDPGRILSNYQVFDFELEELEMQAIDGLN
ncbi:MAG: aldo/keto reductase, partial [Lachnospiraceae bacterium]|nr:aldo/keto reductase [Candidatus Equihabitans merdae]